MWVKLARHWTYESIYFYVLTDIFSRLPILLDLLTWIFKKLFYAYFVYSPLFSWQCLGRYILQAFYIVWTYLKYFFRYFIYSSSYFIFFNALFPLLCCLGFLKSMTLPMVYKSRSVFFFGTITLKSCDFISLLY